MMSKNFDCLQEMLDAQAKLSEKCGVGSLVLQVAMKSTLAQMMVEAGEAMAPWVTETKPWKKQEVDQIVLAETDIEVIDVLHYVLTWFNLRGYDAQDLFEMYMAKNSVNHARVSQKLAEKAKQPTV